MAITVMGWEHPFKFKHTTEAYNCRMHLYCIITVNLPCSTCHLALPLGIFIIRPDLPNKPSECKAQKLPPPFTVNNAINQIVNKISELPGLSEIRSVRVSKYLC